MAATQQGGRRPSAGRPRFVAAASKRPARPMLRLDSAIAIVFVCIASLTRNVPDRGTGIRFYNYVITFLCSADFFTGQLGASFSALKDALNAGIIVL